MNTLGLWRHETWPILFIIIVDDFGVMYVTKDDVNHLIKSIKLTYKLAEDWMGNLYCGITME